MGVGSRYGIVLDHTHSLITWIVDYAGWLVTRYGIGRDGKSPYRILRGRDATSSLCEFAECVQFRQSGASRARGKLQSMLGDGVYLGRTHSSGECIIGTPRGIVKARDVYRRPKDERFNIDMLKSIIGVPWQMTPIPDTEMEEIPEFRVISPEGRSREEHVDQVGSQMPRAAKLTKDIMEQYGYTPHD